MIPAVLAILNLQMSQAYQDQYPMKKKIVVLSGAGISAESGLKTFRDSGGLWEGYRPEDVATPEAFERDPEMVLRFYNQRRKDALNAMPNAAHESIAELENFFDVSVITQNVDNLHERGGSKNVYHLHGSLFESRSSINPTLVSKMKGETIEIGDLCELGSQLRPNIVWFGEPVPMMNSAARIVGEADILIVVGTSLAVYPAASLIHYTSPDCQSYLVDPMAEELGDFGSSIELIAEKATRGIPKLVKSLCSTCD